MGIVSQNIDSPTNPVRFKPTQINETVLLINDANKSVEEADHTIEKANASFQKIPLNEYKPDNSTLQASQ
ncbi:hypothetical protein [Acinetobacter baumannii]|uniref:hypothetical protein n=1 Tax=Acinetobacter baumannii TaxID=470 RepID=UPI0006ACF693